MHCNHRILNGHLGSICHRCNKLESEIPPNEVMSSQFQARYIYARSVSFFHYRSQYFEAFEKLDAKLVQNLKPTFEEVDIP